MAEEIRNKNVDELPAWLEDKQIPTEVVDAFRVKC